MREDLEKEPCPVGRAGQHCEHLTKEARMIIPPWPWVYCCLCGATWDAPRESEESSPYAHTGPYVEIPGRGIVKLKRRKP